MAVERNESVLAHRLLQHGFTAEREQRHANFKACD